MRTNTQDMKTTKCLAGSAEIGRLHAPVHPLVRAAEPAIGLYTGRPLKALVSDAMNQKKSMGFTLLELMITVFVAAIILGLGIPSFQRTVQHNRMAGATNDVVGSFHLARSEAMKRRVPVTVCASNNAQAAAPACAGGGNITGWVVFVDDADIDGDTFPDGNIVIDAGETILQANAALPAQITNRLNNNAYVSFGANGFRRDGPIGPAATMMLFCDARGNVESGTGNSAARMVMIPPNGRPQLMKAIADINFALGQPAPLGGTCP